MAASSTAESLLKRHLRAVRASIAGALDGEVDDVHNVRVSSRRLRELLPVVAGQSPSRKVKRLRRFARKLTRTFGPVREMDVAAELLAALAAHRHLQGIAAVRRTLTSERDRRRRMMLERMDRVDLTRKLDRLAEPEKMVGLEDLQREAPALVAARMLARAARLEETIEAAGSLYEPERLHQVRIAVKKLRYSLELVPELRLGQVGPDLKRLKAAQDLLGSLHDLEVLAAFARSLDVKGTRRRLQKLVGVLDEELRQHHAQFLRRRDALAGVVARVRQRGGELAGLEPAGIPVIPVIIG
jgi:CHAD domain-containing protein